MNYQEALEYLEELNVFGVNLGLARIQRLMFLLGDPQKQYKTIHVTGTNGKGSVTAMLASCLQAAGIRTGMYISPHLSSYTERMVIDGQPVSKQQFAETLSVVRDICEFMQGEGDEHPTQFEVLTAAAFLLFQKAGVEYAVIEVGLGGLLDSTNVIVPEVSVITNVNFEHADKCGGTLEGIATHKAGIIKEGVPVVTGAEGEALEIIAKVAQEKKADLYVAGRDFAAEAMKPLGQLSIPPNLGATGYGVQDRALTDMQMEALSKLHLDCNECEAGQQLVAFNGKNPLFANMNYKLSLLGLHQVSNSGLAAAVFMVLAANDLRFTQKALKKGMKQVIWPGRFELLSGYPYKVLIDGAHNPAGIKTLRQSLDYYFPHSKRIFLLGILKDKDYKFMLEYLLRPEDVVVMTTPDSQRAAEPEQLLPYVVSEAKEAVPEPAKALKRAQDLAKQAGNPEETMLICAGSLYLIGALREMLLQKH